MRRLGTILASGTLACACLFGQTKTAVLGMNRFTDAGFGFSFCYPAAWRVLGEPVADPTRNGWFPDAKIVKELEIRNPAASDNEDQLPGVMIQELLAPRGLTELGRSKSASPVGVDRKIFFDSGTRRWMFETLTESPDGTPPATSPAEITRRTIGGLPIFWGATRGGAEVIVPLDGSTFSRSAHWSILATMTAIPTSRPPWWPPIRARASVRASRRRRRPFAERASSLE